jgi:hypothetical protein
MQREKGAKQQSRCVTREGLRQFLLQVFFHGHAHRNGTKRNRAETERPKVDGATNSRKTRRLGPVTVEGRKVQSGSRPKFLQLVIAGRSATGKTTVGVFPHSQSLKIRTEQRGGKRCPSPLSNRTAAARETTTVDNFWGRSDFHFLSCSQECGGRLIASKLSTDQAHDQIGLKLPSRPFQSLRLEHSTTNCVHPSTGSRSGWAGRSRLSHVGCINVQQVEENDQLHKETAQKMETTCWQRPVPDTHVLPGYSLT